MMKKGYKENTGNFIRKFRRGMLVIIMTGIFLTACGNRNGEEAQSEPRPESAGANFNDDKETEITLPEMERMKSLSTDIL